MFILQNVNYQDVDIIIDQNDVIQSYSQNIYDIINEKITTQTDEGSFDKLTNNSFNINLMNQNINTIYPNYLSLK